MKETAILGLVHYEFAVHSILQWNDDWKFVGNKWGINKSLEKCCWHWCVYVCNRVSSFIIIIYPLTTRVVGEPQMISQPVSSIFPVLHCPLVLGELQACPSPDVVFQPCPLSALSSFPFHCALQDGFGQTWWTGDMSIPLQIALLYDGQEVFMWSNCLLDLGSFLVGNMVFVWDA